MALSPAERIAKLRASTAGRPPTSEKISPAGPNRAALSVNETLEQYPVSRATLYSWMDKGLIESAKIGGRRFILRDLLLRQFEASK